MSFGVELSGRELRIPVAALVSVGEDVERDKASMTRVGAQHSHASLSNFEHTQGWLADERVEVAGKAIFEWGTTAE